MPRNIARIALIAGCIAFVSSAYFVQGGGANQNSRLALTRAIVEDGTFTIDPYHHTTFDKAFRDGHYLCDKAPGLSLLAVPAYALYIAIVGVPNAGDLSSLLWLLTVATVGIATAVATGLLVLVLARLAVRPVISFFGALLWAIGTPAFGYATLFVSHQLAASLLLVGFAIAMRHDIPRWWLAIAGFAVGFACITEYPPIGIAVLIAILAFYRHRRSSLAFAAGAAPPIIFLLFYNQVCFGSPFAIGYSSLAQPEFQSAMGKGVYGVGLPDLEVLFNLLFSEFRGILPLSPFLVLLVVGAVVMPRDRRPEALVCLLSVCYLLAVASGYSVWSGGSAMGPRHFVPALPFAVVLAVVGAEWLIMRRRLVVNTTIAIIALVSVLTCTATVAVMPELPDAAAPVLPGDDIAVRDPKHPLRTFVLPLFLRGRLSVKAVERGGAIGLDCWGKGHEWDAFNLGEAMGLQGLASLLPLLVAWIGAGVLAFRLKD